MVLRGGTVGEVPWLARRTEELITPMSAVSWAKAGGFRLSGGFIFFWVVGEIAAFGLGGDCLFWDPIAIEEQRGFLVGNLRR